MKDYIVYGLGISGVATIKYLAKKCQQVIAVDDNWQAALDLKSKLDSENFAFFHHIKFVKFEEIKWHKDIVAIVAPGIPLYHPIQHKIVDIANKYNFKLICDIELFYQERHQNYNFIGITGTNGKSTTTALINFILNYLGLTSAAGGNIGIAAFDLITLTNNSTCVFEISSFQLDLVDNLHLDVALLTNITPDHIDRHGSMENYIAAKKRIFDHQTASDYAIIGIDSNHCLQLFNSLKNDSNFKANLIATSSKKIELNSVSVIAGKLYNQIDNNHQEFELGDIFLKGEHNAQNIAIAFAACYCHLKQQNLLTTIPQSKIIEAIRIFKGLKHRMQFLGRIDGINFINDSKATNAESSENALKVYDNVYWILGGKEKEGGIEILKPYFNKIKKAYLIGQATEIFAKTLAESKVTFEKCENLHNAFNQAYKDAKDDSAAQKNLLLSPACASFDQWKNFEARGDFFCKLFEELKQDS